MSSKVALVTGGSSGIGLETIKSLLEQNVKVVNGDLQSPSESAGDMVLRAEKSGDLVTIVTDASQWTELSRLFDQTYERFGRLDYVFANAGAAQIGRRFLDETLDENGDLCEPDLRTLDLNVNGQIRTARLAIWHWKKRSHAGSIVFTGSVAGYVRFIEVYYTVSKHAITGLVRSLYTMMKRAGLPIRINAIAPDFTSTGMVSDVPAQKAGIPLQPASAVASAVMELFQNESRNGQTLYVSSGQWREIEERYHEAVSQLMPPATATSHTENAVNFTAAVVGASGQSGW